MHRAAHEGLIAEVMIRYDAEWFATVGQILLKGRGRGAGRHFNARASRT